MYTDKTDQPVQLNIETIGPWPDHGKPHENRMPYMVLNYCICVKGIFPMR
jgi:microcystin-dependent protein